MALGKLSKNIQLRDKPNDVFYTPLNIALKLIEMTELKDDDLVLDPSKGLGVFYDNINVINKNWCEITDGVDFFEYDKPVNVIIGNPPFSLWKKWLDKSIELNPNKIAYIIGCINLTKGRIKLMEKHNYFITKCCITKVNNWFGNTLLVVFEKNGKPLFDTI